MKVQNGVEDVVVWPHLATNTQGKREVAILENRITSTDPASFPILPLVSMIRDNFQMAPCTKKSQVHEGESEGSCGEANPPQLYCSEATPPCP